jgi:hypothetical protein
MRAVAAAVICTLSLFASAASAAPAPCDVLEHAIKQAPRGPVFLASYPTATIGALHGAAFLYDNSVATIALVGCGRVPNADRIGDAILAALDHDRYWHDGRLRNAYQPGTATDTPIKLSGWWDDKQNRWVEDPYQVGSDTGNMAWAMLALLALARDGQGSKYRDGALRIAHWAENGFDTRSPPGFTGGTFGDQPNPQINRWKATEHNVDLAAAFAALVTATGDAHWRQRADQAASFVAAMWDDKCRCFAAGMVEDGTARNNTLALDAQIWPLLAIPGAARKYHTVLATVTQRMAVEGGLAYGDARDGMWTEGMEQAALLMKLLGRSPQRLLAAAERNRAPDGSYFATDVPSLSTGFDLETDPSQRRAYFHFPHLAALAWAALAQQEFNPFTGMKALPANIR